MIRNTKFKKVKPVRINSIKFIADSLKEKFQNFMILSNPRYLYYYSEFKETMRPLKNPLKIIAVVTLIFVGLAIINARQSAVVTPSEMMGTHINLMYMFALMTFINFWGQWIVSSKIPIYR